MTLLACSVIAGSALAQDEALLQPDQIQGDTAVTQAADDVQARLTKLSYTAQNQNEQPEVRADALRQLAQYPSQNALVAVARGLKDPSFVVREAAIIGSDPYQLEHRWRMVAPLLTDEHHSVRAAAAANLARDYNNVSEEQRAQLEAPIAELVAFLEQQQDDGSKLLLADVLRWHNQWEEADKRYQTLLVKDSDNPQLWLNLADNYRAQSKDKEAIDTLDTAIRKLPGTASLHYSKSLALVRLEDRTTAAEEIETAAKLAKDNSYYWYLNGVLQEDLNIDKSTKSFEKAYLISGAPEQLYAVCDIYVRYGNEKTDECLKELGKVAPDYVIKDLKSKQVKGS
ncbi:tetratricopeptide repeat protein [Vibrio sp. SCSIO 43135]|uniref:HEAT repeat domain-containing protein n=1 Tax=Vibrio sp. SCSIO 43135 TaxID=2819096 RepID=UPI002075802F|nr:HEAT repeat domain-containing protein [Vibrio sp. SCSIO 43135]USD42689.1 tetratricopeptide repeat protein [Vibrio sp. SCSIO 43135]